MMNRDEMRRQLSAVRDGEQDARLWKERAMELEHRCRGLTGNGGFTGCSRGTGDREELLARWADAKTEAGRAADGAAEIRQRVEAVLDRLDPPLYRELLTLRYLRQLNWQQVRMRLELRGWYYSERSVYYLHNKALDSAAALWGSASGPEEAS